MRRLLSEGRYAEAEAHADATVMAEPIKQAPYSTVGDLRIDLDGVDPDAVTGYRRTLDLDTAEAVTELTVDGVTHAPRRRLAARPGDRGAPVRLPSGPASAPG